MRMKKINLNILILLLFVSSFGHAQSFYKGTSIIIIKTRDSIIVAADSKLTKIGASKVINPNNSRSLLERNIVIDSLLYNEYYRLHSNPNSLSDSTLYNNYYYQNNYKDFINPNSHNLLLPLDSLIKLNKKIMDGIYPFYYDSLNSIHKINNYDYLNPSNTLFNIDSILGNESPFKYQYQPFKIDSSMFLSYPPNIDIDNNILLNKYKINLNPDSTLFINPLITDPIYNPINLIDPSKSNLLNNRPSFFWGEEVPPSFCKVRINGNVGYAVAGMILHKDKFTAIEDFNIATLVASACQNISELISILNKFEENLKESIVPIWSEANDFDLSSGSYNIQLAFFGFYDNKPFVYRYEFSPDNNFSHSKKVLIDRSFTTGNKVDSLEVYSLGITSKFKIEFIDKEKINGKSAITIAKNFVQFAIEQYKDICGPPIDILVVDKLGFHWIEKKEKCN